MPGEQLRVGCDKADVDSVQFHLVDVDWKWTREQDDPRGPREVFEVVRAICAGVSARDGLRLACQECAKQYGCGIELRRRFGQITITGRREFNIEELLCLAK